MKHKEQSKTNETPKIRELLRILAVLLAVVGPSIALPLLSLAGFTEKQKNWFRERDGHRCQFPEPHPCNGEVKTLQIHHIIPQRYAEKIGLNEADFPENGIALCEYAHQKMVHPDMGEALDAYRMGDKYAYNKAFAQRKSKLDRREIYWDDSWDRIFNAISHKNTQKFKKPFPTKNQSKNR